jgi:hypothetical protein
MAPDPQHPRVFRSPAEVYGSIRLLTMTYDVAILACGREDKAVAGRAIRALRDAVQFVGAEEIADLLAMYDWCLSRIQESDFDSAGITLRGLRESLIPGPRTAGAAPAQL